MDIMQQLACLAINRIMVNCTTVGQALDSMMTMTMTLNFVIFLSINFTYVLGA